MKTRGTLAVAALLALAACQAPSPGSPGPTMAVTPTNVVPRQYVEYCQRNPSDCPTHQDKRK